MATDPRLDAAIDRGFDPKAVYDAPLTKVKEPMRTILEEYGKIPADQIVQHVNTLRDRAFSIYPYVCVGSFAFAEMKISRLPCYDEILERVKGGQRLLDLGCGFGQELRQLAFDGAPSKNLYGADLHLGFINLGYELFRDRSSFDATFIASDVLDDSSALVSQLTAQVDVVYASLIFHHFTWDQQVALARRVVSLLRQPPGSMVVGRNVAYRDVKNLGKVSSIQSLQPFYHDLASWERLWKLVGEEVEGEWELDTWEQPDEWFEQRPDWKEVSYYLCFSFRRV